MLRLVALLVALQDPTTDSLVFIPPKDAKPADIQTAAKMLQKRCEEFGYKGVAAKAVGAEIELRCATGISKKMRPWIEYLASISSSRVVLCFGRELTAIEKDQFENGKTSPPGTSWIKTFGAAPEDKRGEWLLLWDAPRFDISGKIKWVRETSEKNAYFEFDEATTKKLKELKPSALDGMQILVDGRSTKSGRAQLTGSGLPMEGTQRLDPSKTWKWTWERSTSGIGLCINHPLPFALELTAK